MFLLSRRFIGILAVPLLLSMPCALDAQAGTESGDGLSARMEALIGALGEHPRDTLLDFFPRRGEWTWVLTTHYRHGDRAGEWRFRRHDLLPAIEARGPLCESFYAGGDPFTTGSLAYLMMVNLGGWRRVPGNRFVPPGESARSHLFVEWRREDGRWVVSAYGDERYAGPRLLGHAANEVVRDAGPRLPPPAGEPADAIYAAGAQWYEHNWPVVLDGVFMDRHGAPRPLSPEELRRIGTVHGVSVYAEPGSTGRPDVVYVAVSPGVYQPYQPMTGTGCR